MPQWGYILIAVGILVFLLVVFFVSFVLYRKTPVPKGCEHIKIDEKTCAACQNDSCQFYHRDRKEK